MAIYNNGMKVFLFVNNSENTKVETKTHLLNCTMLNLKWNLHSIIVRKNLDYLIVELTNQKIQPKTAGMEAK